MDSLRVSVHARRDARQPCTEDSWSGRVDQTSARVRNRSVMQLTPPCDLRRRPDPPGTTSWRRMILSSGDAFLVTAVTGGTDGKVWPCYVSCPRSGP